MNINIIRSNLRLLLFPSYVIDLHKQLHKAFQKFLEAAYNIYKKNSLFIMMVG